MADKKENKEEELSKSKIAEDQTPEKETPAKVSLIGRLKKYKLYALIGTGAIALAVIGYISFFGNGSDNSEDSSDKLKEHAKTSMSKVVDKSEIDHSSDDAWQNEHVVDINEPGQETQRVVFVDTVTFAENEKNRDVNVQKKRSKKDKTDTVKLTREDYGYYDIDTAEIMKNLEFIFATPGSDSKLKRLSPQDSLDTLSWIQNEMTKLIKERAAIDKRQKELLALEKRIDKSMQNISQAEEANIIKLARLYDGMKAPEVSQLFANLPDDIVVSILPRMKSNNAAKIMALLPPKRAARLSTQMITVLEDK
jgi:flagellar motility protein MotE (MotC chaperone)